MSDVATITPGGTIGVLGSGQLGRMLALVARQMGYHVHVFSPAQQSPTGQVADRIFAAAYDDLAAVRDFAASCDVVTYEFENVPAATAAACADIVPLRPGRDALHVAQNRVREKQFLAGLGLPVAPYAIVDSAESCRQAAAKIGGNGWVLKSAETGYDGKGQAKFNEIETASTAWQTVNSSQAVLEQLVAFEHEISVVAARGLDGSFVHYGAILNEHHNHILDVSFAPNIVSADIENAAVEMARTILEALNVVGVLCTEFFLTADGNLFVNEIAPRPHNSGHLTIEGCVTSQFEQQLRAICGLPLGATTYLGGVAMANLLGDLWESGEPDWSALATIPQAKLHLYGKEIARIGRKMGHVTAVATDSQQAKQIVQHARQLLKGRHD